MTIICCIELTAIALLMSEGLELQNTELDHYRAYVTEASLTDKAVAKLFHGQIHILL